MTLTIERHPDHAAMSARAAAIVSARIRERRDLHILPSTGRSPMELYRRLAEEHTSGDLDTSRLNVFQLDEYVGVSSTDKRSLYRWLRESLLEPLAIAADRVVALPGEAADPDEACREYDRKVQRAGGMDLAVLGLGPNGHLGYNEPPSGPTDPSRVVRLTPESVRGATAYWPGLDIPQRAMTAGMSVILGARAILLVASGSHKAGILASALEGPMTPSVPASYLQEAANVIVVADEAACAELRSG